MAEKRFNFKLKDSPNGNRFKDYFEKMKTMEPKELMPFMKAVCNDCHSFLLNNLSYLTFPPISVKLVFQTDKFKQIEKEESKNSVEMEVPKTPALAFTIVNGDLRQIYVDAEGIIKLLSKGYPTFILSLSGVFIHELLHCVYSHGKTEREIINMECSMIEEFMGMELPEEVRKAKLADYYENET